MDLVENILLDANIIIRFLTNDDDIQSPLVFKIFEKAVRHEFTLILSPIIVAECTWVLLSRLEQSLYSRFDII